MIPLWAAWLWVVFGLISGGLTLAVAHEIDFHAFSVIVLGSGITVYGIFWFAQGLPREEIP